jgi:hypothetical protein
MAETIKVHDKVTVRSSGMPGLVVELQGDGHAQVYLAGLNGTQQFALTDLELGSDASDEDIESKVLVESKSGQVISPVPADTHSFAEAFPEAAAAAAPAQPDRLDHTLSQAHPWPGQVTSGLFNEAGGVYESKEAQRKQALAEARSQAERDEEEELLKRYPPARAGAGSERSERSAASTNERTNGDVDTDGERAQLQARAKAAGIDARQSNEALKAQLAERERSGAQG